MATLNFPSSPSINQQYTANGSTWTWDGTSWLAYNGPASGYSGISGYSGYSGYSGFSGFSGESGFSGFSGLGLSGYSGYSGISGYSGVYYSATSITSAASITPNGAFTQYDVTALAQAATILPPSGTPAAAQKLIIRIKDNGSPQTLSWTTFVGGYRIVGTTLPSTTVPSKVLYVGCIYNSQDTYWDVVALSQEV